MEYVYWINSPEEKNTELNLVYLTVRWKTLSNALFAMLEDFTDFGDLCSTVMKQDLELFL